MMSYILYLLLTWQAETNTDTVQCLDKCQLDNNEPITQRGGGRGDTPPDDDEKVKKDP